MTRYMRLALVGFLVAAALLIVAGCAGPKEAKLEPKVAPPAIKEAGTLRVGADLSYPPFAGTENGKQAGLDLDVAAALAEHLGVTVAVVDVDPSEAATALAQGTVDAVLSVPFSAAGLANTSMAGSYLTDGPAFFVATDSTASVDASLTLDTLVASKIGVQEGSAAYWKLASEVGTEGVTTYPTLRDAISAASAGEVQLVAGDAAVAAYIVRDFPLIHFAGQLEPAVPLGVAVNVDNTVLGDAIRDALDALAADGVLNTIRRKWLDGLPELVTAESVDATATP